MRMEKTVPLDLIGVSKEDIDAKCQFVIDVIIEDLRSVRFLRSSPGPGDDWVWFDADKFFITNVIAFDRDAVVSASDEIGSPDRGITRTLFEYIVAHEKAGIECTTSSLHRQFPNMSWQEINMRVRTLVEAGRVKHRWGYQTFAAHEMSIDATARSPGVDNSYAYMDHINRCIPTTVGIDMSTARNNPYEKHKIWKRVTRKLLDTGHRFNDFYINDIKIVGDDTHIDFTASNYKAPELAIPVEEIVIVEEIDINEEIVIETVVKLPTFTDIARHSLFVSDVMTALGTDDPTRAYMMASFVVAMSDSSEVDGAVVMARRLLEIVPPDLLDGLAQEYAKTLEIFACVETGVDVGSTQKPEIIPVSNRLRLIA